MGSLSVALAAPADFDAKNETGAGFSGTGSIRAE
jgi:hypothetical protein